MLKWLNILKIKFVTEVFYFCKEHILRNENFKVQLYLSHGKTNPFGVLIAFYGNVNVVVKNQFDDGNGRILILEKMIDDTKFDFGKDDWCYKVSFSLCL